jgi:hypothetical protein
MDTPGFWSLPLCVAEAGTKRAPLKPKQKFRA